VVGQARRLCEMAAVFAVVPAALYMAQPPHFMVLGALAAAIAFAAMLCWFTRVPPPKLGMAPSSRRAFLPAVLTGGLILIAVFVALYYYRMLAGRILFQPMPYTAVGWVAFALG